MDESLKSEIFCIRSVLERLRKADFDSQTSFFNSTGFPRGCCGDATSLLGLYLKQSHNLESYYVCGEGLDINPSCSHAWLLFNGWIIDITADQFNDRGYSLPPVIIETDSEFHQQFFKYETSCFDVCDLIDTGIPKVLKKVMSEIAQ